MKTGHLILLILLSHHFFAAAAGFELMPIGDGNTVSKKLKFTDSLIAVPRSTF
jgi:hypothetical protein